MKYVKMLGLVAVAAMALLAFAGPASATVLKNAGVNMKVGDALSASVETSALLKTGGGTTIATCTGGTVAGKITDAGSATTTVKGSINTGGLTWSGCTTTVDTLAEGTLELHYTSGNNGTVTSSGAQVTIQFLGVSCIFKTNNTDIGTFTGGNPGTFDINGTIPQSGGGFLCPENGIWSGAYKATTPAGTLDVAAS